MELDRIVRHHLAHPTPLDPTFSLQNFLVRLHSELPDLLLSQGEDKGPAVALTLRDAVKFCEALRSLRTRCPALLRRPNGPQVLAGHAALLVYSETQPSRAARETSKRYLLQKLGVSQEELIPAGSGPLGPLEMQEERDCGEMPPRMAGAPSPFAYTKYSTARLQTLAMMAATRRLVVLDGMCVCVCVCVCSSESTVGFRELKLRAFVPCAWCAPPILFLKVGYTHTRILSLTHSLQGRRAVERPSSWLSLRSCTARGCSRWWCSPRRSPRSSSGASPRWCTRSQASPAGRPSSGSSSGGPSRHSLGTLPSSSGPTFRGRCGAFTLPCLRLFRLCVLLLASLALSHQRCISGCLLTHTLPHGMIPLLLPRGASCFRHIRALLSVIVGREGCSGAAPCGQGHARALGFRVREACHGDKPEPRALLPGPRHERNRTSLSLSLSLSLSHSLVGALSDLLFLYKPVAQQSPCLCGNWAGRVEARAGVGTGGTCRSASGR